MKEGLSAVAFIVIAVSVYLLGYYLRVQQEEIDRIQFGAGLRINMNSQPGDTIKIKNAKTYIFHPSSADSAVVSGNGLKQENEDADLPVAIRVFFACGELNWNRKTGERLPWRGSVAVDGKNYDCTECWENSKHKYIGTLGAGESVVDTLQF